MLKQILIPAGILAGTAAAALFAMRPYNKRKNIFRKRFKQTYIAHRGLFSLPDIPENSLPAFAEAADKGYAIELDVQLAKDDRLVVFHDETLQRMCGDPRLLRELSYEDLQKLTLSGTKERIPLFEDVLRLVDGRVPLVVEIKPEGRYIQTTKLTAEVLKKYPGIYCVESFNPVVMLWFRKHRPEVLRGQLSTNFKKDGDTHPRPVQFILQNMLTNFLSHPDFIAYNHIHAKDPAFRICTRLFNSLNAAWTIKNEKELKAAKKDFEYFIFDSFRP